MRKSMVPAPKPSTPNQAEGEADVCTVDQAECEAGVSTVDRVCPTRLSTG
jgi:hypothetical protein